MLTDLRCALRLIVRRPFFAMLVVFTIALGIASSTTAFAVVHGVLLEPMPYPQPERLVYIWEHDLSRGNDRSTVSPANYIAWTEGASSFSAMAAFSAASASITGDGEPERVGVINTTVKLLPMLGVRPVLGRLFLDGEDVEGAPPVALLSESFWRRRYGADPGVVGRTIQINDQPTTIVGVLPASFRFEPPVRFNFDGTTDVWTPLQLTDEFRTTGGRYLQVLARLATNITVEQAQGEVDALADRLRSEVPRQANWGINIVPLQEQVTGGVSRALLVVFGAVSLVLLFACVNVGNLLLTRATERRQEIAVRAALGASRAHIARQLVMESLTLALLGGATGLLFATWAIGALRAMAPDIPRLDLVSLHAPVLLFAVAVTMFTGALFGAAPIVHVVRSDLPTWLRGRGGEGGRRAAKRTRSAIVIVEIALSLVLLVGAGLLIQGHARLIRAGVGFDTERLLTATIELPAARYPEAATRAAFFNRLVQRVAALPDVEAASAITFAPLSGLGSATSFRANDRPVPPPGQHPGAEIRSVHRDYLRTMGIDLVRGRTFDTTDNAGAPLHIVISQTLQRELWPDSDAIGKTLSIPWGDTLVAEIVGIARDINLYGPDVPPRAVVYFNHEQFQPHNAMTLVVRTRNDPLAIVPQMRSTVRAMDTNLPVYDVRSMESRLNDALSGARFAAVALGAFAVIALALALIGTYGVMSCGIGQRLHEFAVRIAIGADRANLIGLVLRQASRLVALGLVFGILAGLALSRALQGLVFGVGTTDALTFACMTALLAITALAACWLPARRASERAVRLLLQNGP